MIYVIGSGPAGVACAMGLLERGQDVCMLDGGVELESPAQTQVDHLASQPSEQWNPASLAFLKTNVFTTTDGIPQKVAFGSDYPYQHTSDFFPMTRRGVHMLPSLARGGLSTVWGAAVLPHRAQEINDWPITLKDLEPHYQAVLKFVPFAAAKDDLEALFPLYSERFGELKLSRQAQSMNRRFNQNKVVLNREHITFGQARLAVRTRDEGVQKGCVYCGLCMYGCPYGCIYSSAHTLETLQKNPKFRYERSVVVKRLDETPDAVTIHAENLSNRKPVTFSGARVFLACGILPTTQILLMSLQAFNKPVPMPYSQHFLLPLLNMEGEPDVQQERLNTLSQLFLEVMDAQISPDVIHLQVYTYNDLYAEGLKKSILGPFFKAIPRITDWALGKVLVIQGYLHSRYSTPIQLQLSRNSPDNQPRLMLEGQHNPVLRQKIHQLVKKLSRLRNELGAWPLSPWLKISPPGQGFHNVGTFPMTRIPVALQSDIWGKPHGFNRVHAVDATVLPSAPASTITLSVMANAHRIGSSAPLD